MHPNLVGVRVSAEIILLLFSRELFSYAIEKFTQEEVLPSAAATVRRLRLDCPKERFGELSCFTPQVWMDEPFRHQAMAGTAQTVGHVGFELRTQ